MFDGKAFGEEVVGFVRDYVDKEVAPVKAENEQLRARIKELEDRPTPEVIAPEPPDLPDFGPLISEAVQKAVDALPKAKDGENGVGLGGALIDRQGHLIITLTDGQTHDLGKVVGKDGQDAAQETSEDWAVGLSTEEKAGLISSLLRRELGDGELILLPEPQPIQAAKAGQQHAAPLVIHNHLPSRGVEKTVVTKHDERGRILEFERREV